MAQLHLAYFFQPAIVDLESETPQPDPHPKLLEPRGLNKWASFMHLIISDCTDRSSVFLPLFFYFIRCLAKRKLLNEKAETSIKGVEVSQRNEEQMLLEESPSDGHVLSGDVMLISDSWKPRFRMLVLKPRRYVSFLNN